MHSDFAASDGIYLLSHSVGRPLRQASDHLQKAFFAPWESAMPEPWTAWMAALNDFQAALAGLLSGDAAHFCPQANLSSAMTKVLFSLPKRSGRQTILLSRHDFPSMGFVARQATTLGYELAFLPHGVDETDPQIWADALTPDVQWLLLTHVQSNTGLQIPIADILRLARQRDILTVVDIAQSVGILPIDVDAWGASFVLGSSVKWLCGGPGAGFLWIHPEWVGHCRPLDVGWFSHENPFEFDIQHFAYHPGAMRFWGGTPSVLPFAMATPSIRYLTEFGIEKVRSHNLALTQRLIDCVDPACLTSPRAPASRGGTVVVDFGDRQPEIVQRMKQRNIHFDVRARGIRLSPHVYNQESEMAVVVDAFLAS